MAAPLTPEEHRRRSDAWNAGMAAGQTTAAIARALGIKPSTLREWHSRECILPDAPLPPMDVIPPAEPAERHDASFWRRRAKESEREVDRLSRLAQELAGVRAVAPCIPDWLRSGPGPRRPSVLIVHTSDWHDGEVIAADEIQGVNAFNPDICERRLLRLVTAACDLGARWQADTDPRGVLLTLDGDLISGDIHEELTRTNALTSHEQVRHASGIAVAMIRELAAEFGRVHVVGTPGNHGRTTIKPTAKLYGRRSYDILICAMVADALRDDTRVTFQADGATDQIVPLLGWNVLVTHGDKIGTGGGQGFAGPVLPILRGTHKVRAQQSAIGAAPDLQLIGHFHTSCAVPGVLANGSVPGYSEYGRDLRAGVEPPKQWVALMTQKWGLRERCDVQLEEPPLRAKVRVRAPAEMRA